MRVAVIGAGYLGQHHARIYSELDDVELAGVVDSDEERAKEVARRYGAAAYRNYKDIVNDVDALSIVVPTSNHYEIALDCIRAGKDLLVEKPITGTVSEADDLIAEAENAGCILQVGHLERYNPGVIALSRMVEEPQFLDSVRVSPYLNRSRDVDVTLDLMIHDIDIVLTLVSSPIKRMNAFGFSFVTEKIDEARAWIDFESGAVASFTASRIAPEKQRRLKVFQKNLYIELDYQSSVVELHYSADPLNTERVEPERREPLKEELKDFVRCVMSREHPKVSGVEGRDALNVALKITSLIERR